MKSIVSVRSGLQTLRSGTAARLHPFLTLPSTETPVFSFPGNKVGRSLKASRFQQFLVWLHFSFDLLFYLKVWGFPHHPPFQELITVIIQLLIAADLASAENIRENASLCSFASEKRRRWIGTFPPLYIDLNRRRGSCQMDFLFAHLILHGWYHRARKLLNARFSYIRGDKQQRDSPPYVGSVPSLSGSGVGFCRTAIRLVAETPRPLA